MFGILYAYSVGCNYDVNVWAWPVLALVFSALYVVDVVSMSGFICSLWYDITCKLPNDI